MRKTFLFTTIIIIGLSAASCKKEAGGNSVEPNSTVTGKINGVPWKNGSYARFNRNDNSKFGIAISTDSNGVEIYGMSIDNVNLHMLVQKIHAGVVNGQISDSCSAGFGDGIDDEMYDSYNLREQESGNQFVITSYDPNMNIVSGTFQMTLYRTFDLSRPGMWFPDTIRITDGAFTLPIHPYENH